MPLSPRVVLADDESTSRILVRSLVTNLGWLPVGQGTNGQEAIEMVAREKPDLVILDMYMAGMDGVDAIPQILAAVPDACVVMLTSLVDDKEIARCLASGASALIRKDAPIARMKQQLAGVWNKHRAAHEKQAPT